MTAETVLTPIERACGHTETRAVSAVLGADYGRRWDVRSVTELSRCDDCQWADCWCGPLWMFGEWDTWPES